MRLLANTSAEFRPWQAGSNAGSATAGKVLFVVAVLWVVKTSAVKLNPEQLEQSSAPGITMFCHHPDGQLCDKEGQPFEFNYYKEKSKNQQRYERIGEVY